MHRTPLGHIQIRNKARLAAVVLGACAPVPAFAADVVSTAWGSYLFLALVATVVIVLLLHEALGDDDGMPGDEERANDALGLPRFVHARQDRSPDRARRPHA